MWKFGCNSAINVLKNVKLQYLNAHWIQFLMIRFRLMYLGRKLGNAHLMLWWWILIILEGMNWLEGFYLQVSYFCLFSYLWYWLIFFFFLGKNGSGASETKHWQDMITKPRQTIVQWHRLKPEWKFHHFPSSISFKFVIIFFLPFKHRVTIKIISTFHYKTVTPSTHLANLPATPSIFYYFNWSHKKVKKQKKKKKIS